MGYSLVAIGEPDKPLIVNIARGVISTLGNLLAIPGLGIIGAPLINILSNFIATPMDMFFLARRKFYVKPMEYIKPLIVFGTISAIFILLNSSSYLFKLGTICLFVFSCFMLSVITKADFQSIFGEAKAIVLGFNLKNKIEKVSS